MDFDQHGHGHGRETPRVLVCFELVELEVSRQPAAPSNAFESTIVEGKALPGE
jgi:hypothetical protein